MSEEKHLIVGIDPDVDKNGVSAWNVKSKSFEFITSMTLHELMTYFIESRDKIKVVVVEAGWLNKGNYHTWRQNKKSAVSTGNDTGRNHQRGIDIVELMEWLSMPCRLQRPLSPNTWKEDESMFRKITGTKGGNPEKRDSAMLVFNATR